MIYLASPYSHPDKTVESLRFGQVCRIAGVLMSRGFIVFSPIAQSHPIAERCNLPTTWDYWEKFDREFISASSELVVAMMPGWKESKGVTAEIGIANELGIPVSYLEVDDICGSKQ